MKKGVIFGAIIIVIIVSLLTVSIMRIEEVPIITVKAEVTVTDGNPAVKIVTLEQDAVNPLKSPRGSATTSFPSVDALAIINNAKVSYWASNSYVGNGTYDFVIGFPRGITPKQGDMVKVIVNVVDERGRTLASDKRVRLWE
ncbi:MAG: hypothetical protein JJE19_05415 [Methanosarcinales archaeon]|nr:hypothetical protein [Methanosarcinales archaeon]